MYALYEPLEGTEIEEVLIYSIKATICITLYVVAIKLRQQERVLNCTRHKTSAWKDAAAHWWFCSANFIPAYLGINTPSSHTSRIIELLWLVMSVSLVQPCATKRFWSNYLLKYLCCQLWPSNAFFIGLSSSIVHGLVLMVTGWTR